MRITQRTADPESVAALEAAGLPAPLARALAARGVRSSEELFAGCETLLPYRTLTGCVEAAQILSAAIDAQRPVLIVADFDCDGATGCAVLMRALTALGAKASYLIPQRLTEGYGLTPAIVERAAASGASRGTLIVTVDNGIASHDGIERAAALGIDVLVTDHHLPTDAPLRAVGVVNPNQHGCGFASKALAGVGVAWYVAWALTELRVAAGRAPAQFDVRELLQYVAIGTVADVVPLDANNRTLVREGLARIRHRALPGIAALARAAGRESASLTTSDIAFAVGPRINAAGRLASMATGVNCLLETDPVRAQEYAQLLSVRNDERKDIELAIFEEAFERLAPLAARRRTLVAQDERWHPGVIGIAASRIKDYFHRPTFVLSCQPDGTFKGSGRSIPGFHLRDALERVNRQVPGALLRFGGHAMAAGLTLAAGQADAFAQAFEAVGAELVTDEMLEAELLVDGPLAAHEASPALVRLIKELVWGQGFPEPTFYDRFAVRESRVIGKDRTHTSFVLEREGEALKAVRFRWTGHVPGRIAAAYKLDLNTFRGETTLQALIEHLEPERLALARAA